MKKLLLVSTVALFTGCGGSDSSGGGDDGDRPEINSGDVVVTKFNLNSYTTLGTVSSDNGLLGAKTVGITNYGSVEELTPEVGIPVEEDLVIPPSCLALPTVKVLSIDNVTDEWQLINADVPVHFTECDFDSYENRYYLFHKLTEKVYSFPEGFIPSYVNDQNEKKLMVLPAKSHRNETSNPAIVITEIKNYTQNVYFLKAETIESGAQLELIIPSVKIGSWDYDKFAFIDSNYAYYTDSYSNQLMKIEWKTGKLVQSWFGEYVTVPFKFQGKLYTVEYGDSYYELLSDGTFGEHLQLPPNSFSNSYNVELVIDDRYIIGDRCSIWDMTLNVGYVPFGGTGRHDIEYKDGELFCSGEFNDWDNSTSGYFFGGFSFNLESAILNQEVVLPSKQKIEDSLRMSAPNLMYIDNEENVFEDDHVTINLINGEKTVVKHYYDGEKVIDLKPLS